MGAHVHTWLDIPAPGTLLEPFTNIMVCTHSKHPSPFSAKSEANSINLPVLQSFNRGQVPLQKLR